MTDENPKEKTVAEKLKETRISNLKSLAMYEGARYLQSDEVPYGASGKKAGSEAYTQFLMSENSDKTRKELYKSKLEQAANSDAIAKPQYTSDFELEQNALGLIDDGKAGLNLGDLEKIVGEVAPGYLEFKVPKKLKGKNVGAIEKKILENQMKVQKEMIDYQKQLEAEEITEEELKDKIEELKTKVYKPTPEEQEIMKIHEAMEFAYTDGAANTIQRKHKMAELNKVGKEIEEGYKPKPESTNE